MASIAVYDKINHFAFCKKELNIYVGQLSFGYYILELFGNVIDDSYLIFVTNPTNIFV